MINKINQFQFKIAELNLFIIHFRFIINIYLYRF
jgi:hypothetical protein